jgi:DNA-binding NarL/FixJ family response regulator
VGKAEKEIFDLVRAGIERFILKNATVEDFLRTIRAVAEEEKTYAHQLTRSVLSTIVKEAIRKRNHRQSK